MEQNEKSASELFAFPLFQAKLFAKFNKKGERDKSSAPFRK